ncbi:MAG TPA: hypothetical protein VMA98_12590 [Candidatus Acidoferrales bacterium]|nr:hypothetical protein [Candidatus Acidoferrales bacterium]
MVLSICGFVFHAIASRCLGVDAYGALYALISLMGIAGMPVAVFTPVITKFSAEFTALHDDGHVRGLIELIVRVFAVVGAVYVIAGVLLAAPLASYLHVATWEIPIVGVMVAVGIASGTLRAISQGVHAYGTYASSMAGEGITKVLGLGAIAFGGLTLFGGTLAFLCGLAAGAVVVALPLLRRYQGIAAQVVVLDWPRIFATIGGALVLTVTMTCIGFADVLLVKHYFDPQQAGLYAAASLSGKILMYFVGFVPAVLIPQATHRHARGEQTRKILWAAVLFIGVVSVIGIFAYKVAGIVLLHLLVGRAFDAALPLLPTYAAAMAALAVTNSLASYGVATHRLAFAVPLLVAVLATLALIAAVHPSLAAVVGELLIGNLVMLGAVAVSLGAQGLREARA